jgi:hypothetical protein
MRILGALLTAPKDLRQPALNRLALAAMLA